MLASPRPSSGPCRMTMPRKPVRAKRPKRAPDSQCSKTDERRARSDKRGDQASLRMQDSPVASEWVFPGSTTECDVYAGQLARTFPVDVTTPVAQCSSATATPTPAANSIAGIRQLPSRGSQVECHRGSRPYLFRSPRLIGTEVRVRLHADWVEVY